MTIKQFEYKPLSHFSYILLSEGKMVVIDPERNPQQYYDFASDNNAEIVAVIETHPHADFVSSHLEIHKATGATIYASKEMDADYPHKPLEDGDEITLENVTLKALHTPGHSPDSITIVATEGRETVLFTGDTLMVGDVGRPDLREKAGNKKAKRKELAEMMYETVSTKFTDLPDDAVIYPAHGAGSLCGKSMGDASSSTLGDERRDNWAFKTQTKKDFVKNLLDDLPFIPHYFGYDVDMNKKGAADLKASIGTIPFAERTNVEGLIIDMRDEMTFKKGHLDGSINIQAVSDTAKFETWLGSIVQLDEPFTFVIDAKANKDNLLHRVAKIGYEKLVKQVVTLLDGNLKETETLNLNDFKNNPDNYTIVDVRNESEVEEGKIFESAISHPLNELRESINDIPTDKPIVVHCAGGYRSAAGTSIIQNKLDDVKVFDLSDHIKDFK